jgi:hypothetical protein
LKHKEDTVLWDSTFIAQVNWRVNKFYEKKYAPGRAVAPLAPPLAWNRLGPQLNI